MKTTVIEILERALVGKVIKVATCPEGKIEDLTIDNKGHLHFVFSNGSSGRGLIDTEFEILE